ncbi:MAG: formylglycine-generating enzyme family protein [Planctomycetota bacterium]
MGSFGSGVGSGLHLEVNGGVPGEFGYLLVGDEASASFPISNGVLCLGGSPGAHIYRYNVTGTEWVSVGQFDAGGVLVNLVGTSAIGTGFDVPDTVPDAVPIPIMTGDTWHFQCWYRDTAVSSTDSNLSTGLTVTFQPPGTPIPGMIALAAGSFAMGSDAPAGVPYYGGLESQPVHPVTISYPFWMAQHEVTQLQYETVMGSNPSAFTGNILRPVESVTWFDARTYCALLTAQQAALGNVPAGWEYRLPTEAEWEYACRAGSSTEFSLGDEIHCGEAWFAFDNHLSLGCGNPAGPTTVRSYAPNAWGLFDMHGNVYEWCLDSYDPYQAGAATDPFVTGGTTRLLRGGSWGDFSSSLRSGFRGQAPPTAANPSIGFRVVLAPALMP